VLRNVLTFPGSEAYQPGVEPAANALAKELAWAGSASSLRTDDGTAVSRTLRMEEGGRRAVMDAATLSRLERTAELVGREVTPATEALGRSVRLRGCYEGVLNSQCGEIGGRVVLSPDFVWSSQGQASEAEKGEVFELHYEVGSWRKEVVQRLMK
jgi:hypothetical protein